MAQRKQKVTHDFITELDSELDKKKTIFIDTIKGKAEVEINVYFDESKINHVITSLVELITSLLASEEISTEDLASPVILLPALILREFTDLPIPKENDLALMTAVNENLQRHGIARQVFDKFSVKELKKVSKLVEGAFKNIPKVQGTYHELYSKYAIQQMN